MSEIRLRDIKDAKYAKTQSIFDLAIARHQRNIVTNMKRNLKKAFYSDSIREARGDSKKLWKLLKTLFRNCDSKSKIQEIDGESDLPTIANKFNEFFTNIGPTLADAIPDSALNIDYSVKVDHMFEFSPVAVKEVYEILRQMSPAKATGGDNLPVRLLKYDLMLVSNLIVHIVNLSLATLTVPEQWKCAIVKPLYKEGAPDSASNYRPISILPACSKVLEKVVHRQLNQFFQENKLFSEAQFGFRKNHSTVTCINTLLDNVFTNMDNGLLTGVIFLDLKKAFDTVDHQILLKKLHMYGVSPRCIEWFKSYLTGRKQVTVVQGTKSSPLDVACGVPQGSILGPLLFIIYINDMAEYLDQCQVSLYADDTAMYYGCRSQVDLMLTLRIELSTVSEWLKANRLTLNVAETKFCVFGTRQRLNNLADFELTINNQVIEQVSQVKYLGMILDESLNFNAHIDYTVKKASSRLGAVRRARKFLDVNTSLTLYKSLVLPYLDYGDTVFCTTSAYNLDRLQKLQNSACRSILCRERDSSVNEMHKDLSLIYLCEQRYIHMGVECYKSVHGGGDYSLTRFFVPIHDVRPRITRATSRRKLHIPRVKTTVGSNAMRVRGPVFWNSLSDELTVPCEIKAFKRSISSAVLQSDCTGNHNFPT